jgi:hypothetical protein
VKKLLLMSVLIATIAIPAWAAGARNPRRALKGAIVYWSIYNVVYWLLLLFVYDRLS